MKHDLWLKESGYFKSSRTLLYGFMSVVPLLLIYEVLVFNINQDQVIEVRNGADVIFKALLSYFGLHGPFAYGLLLFGAIFLLIVLRGQGQAHFRPQFVFLILVESAIYAILLGFAVGHLTHYVLSGNSLTTGPVPHIMLSVGAGVYEELIFRALLFGTTAIALQKLFKFRSFTAHLLAAVMSSLFFSAFHYIGGETIELYSFVYRFFAGLLFCVIFKTRGYGVAAYTHTFYDLLILV